MTSIWRLFLLSLACMAVSAVPVLMVLWLFPLIGPWSALLVCVLLIIGALWGPRMLQKFLQFWRHAVRKQERKQESEMDEFKDDLWW